MPEPALDPAKLSRLKAQLRGGGAVTSGLERLAPRPELPDLGVIFFSGLGHQANPYEALLEVAKYVDGAGFKAVWTPERHFTDVGGAYPNPAVLGAALAMVTERVRIRAGSVNLPLHDVLRVAEEWALVDLLSGGRVDIAVAPGWHARDFVLNPEAHETRGEVLHSSREDLQALWRGEWVERKDPTGQVQQIVTYPRPVQPELPVWLTTSQSAESWQRAGELGLNVLTALINFGPPELERRIRLYRTARADAGLDPAGGVVSLMLHTYVAEDADAAVREVRPALTDYLGSFVTQHATSGQKEATAKSATLQNLGGDRDEFLEMVFQRYVTTSSLIGDVDQAQVRMESFKKIGVDEIACLVDFGMSREQMMASLTRLSRLLTGAVQE